MMTALLRLLARGLTLAAMALLCLLNVLERTQIAGGVAFDTASRAVGVTNIVAVASLIVWGCLEAWARRGSVTASGALRSYTGAAGHTTAWPVILRGLYLVASALYQASFALLLLVSLDEARFKSFPISDNTLPSPLPVFEAIAFVLLALAAATEAVLCQPLARRARHLPGHWGDLRQRLYGVVMLGYAVPLILLGVGTRHWSMPAAAMAAAITGSVLACRLRELEHL